MTVTIPRGRRHECSGQVTPHCAKGDGKGPAKCRACGGTIHVFQGCWGVFTWTGTGRYPLELAHRLYARYAAAERYIAVNTDYVVRWVGAPP